MYLRKYLKMRTFSVTSIIRTQIDCKFYPEHLPRLNKKGVNSDLEKKKKKKKKLITSTVKI